MHIPDAAGDKRARRFLLVVGVLLVALGGYLFWSAGVSDSLFLAAGLFEAGAVVVACARYAPPRAIAFLEAALTGWP